MEAVASKVCQGQLYLGQWRDRLATSESKFQLWAHKLNNAFHIFFCESVREPVMYIRVGWKIKIVENIF